MEERKVQLADVSDLIDVAYQQISDATKKLTPGLLDKQMAFALSKKHIGCEYTVKELNERKPKERYSFYSFTEVKIALQEFFGDTYNLKRIAKQSVMLDEGDKFSESIDCGMKLGEFYDTLNNTVTETSILEVTMKVRPWGNPNNTTGLPFNIVGFRLQADEEGQWVREIEPAKEIKEEEWAEWKQMNIFQFIR